jgi:hypothetical protein
MYIKVKTGGSRTLDRIYAQSKAYFKYLRYGLTFLEYYDKENEGICEKVELVRKGLMRVFELKIDYLLEDYNSFNESGKIISQKDSNVRNYIIGEALDILESTSKLPILQGLKNDEVQVELCHYVQTDGINIQISWCSNLQ